MLQRRTGRVNYTDRSCCNNSRVSLITGLGCSQNAGFLEVLPDMLQRRTGRVNYTDRSCCNTNDNHYVTGGGGIGKPTGADHGPSREGGELLEG